MTATWLDLPPEPPFGLATLPYGVLSTTDPDLRRVGVRIGDVVLDAGAAAEFVFMESGLLGTNEAPSQRILVGDVLRPRTSRSFRSAAESRRPASKVGTRDPESRTRPVATITSTVTPEGHRFRINESRTCYEAAKAATAPMTVTAGERSPGGAPELATAASVVRTTCWLGRPPSMTQATGVLPSRPAFTRAATIDGKDSTPMRTTRVVPPRANASQSRVLRGSSGAA